MTQEIRKTSFLERLILIIGCLMALYHLVTTQYLFQGFIEHQDFHLGFALILVFLTTIKKMRSRKPWLLALQFLLLAASLAVVTYIKVNYRHLEIVHGLPETPDFIMGVILVIVVLEATRQAWGPILPIIAILFMLYFIFGQYLPEAFWHPPYDIGYIVSMMGIGFVGTFGTFLGISANYIFLFLVFGGVLQACGALELIIEVGKAAGRVLAGGPAQTAVIGSSLVGTVSGSAVANVALTGVFTIPLMKKVGYRPEIAGAVEATASTGGQIMPPIMGAAAFVMASFISVPYATIMIAAIIPSILYYFSVGLGVQVIALKEKIRAPKETINTRLMLHRAPIFLIPLAILVVMLLRWYSPMYCAFYAIMALVALSFLRKETRPSWYTLAKGFANGAVAGANIAVVCSCVGIMAQTLFTTALGIKFTGLVEVISGGQLIPALLLTMVVSVILGCGVPTTGAYVLVALVVCPMLVRIGVLPVAAHMFAFYFAIISTLTPPVAVAALAGAGIAGSKYWATAIEAVKLAVSGFIIPFFFLFNPVFLLQPGQPTMLGGILTLIASILTISAIVAVTYGHFLLPITWWERMLYAVCVVIFFFFIFTTSQFLLFGVATALFAVLMILQWRTRKRSTHAKAASAPA